MTQAESPWPKAHLWTVGHSTHLIDEFIALLQLHRIGLVADVRLFPGSRRHPQFNRDDLVQSLAAAAIEYQHFPELGGRRQPRADSKNTAWRNAAFRGYADHMETKEFAKGISRLLMRAKTPTAITCAESLWWRCHRSLIADYLKAQGNSVFHILDGKKVDEHPYTKAARIVGGKLDYSKATDDEKAEVWF